MWRTSRGWPCTRRECRWLLKISALNDWRHLVNSRRNTHCQFEDAGPPFRGGPVQSLNLPRPREKPPVAPLALFPLPREVIPSTHERTWWPCRQSVRQRLSHAAADARTAFQGRSACAAQLHRGNPRRSPSLSGISVLRCACRHVPLNDEESASRHTLFATECFLPPTSYSP